MLPAIAVALLLMIPGAVGPPLPPGTGEGDFVEIGGEVYQAHGGVLYTLDDPALDDPAHTVTVSASRVDTDDQKRVLRAEVVSAEAIRESGARTLAEILSEQAGVQVNSSLGLGQEVQMDGLDGRHVLILVDGRPVNGRTNNRVDVSRLPVDASTIERIEIVRGPMSALYGSEALGGVVNIITRRAQARLGLEAESQTRVVTGAVWQTLGAHARGGVGPLVLRLDVTGSDLPRIDRGGRDPVTGGAVARADGKPDLPDRRQAAVHAEAAAPLPGTFTARLQVDGSTSQSVARTSPVAPFRDRATGTEGSAAVAVDGEVWPLVEVHGDVRVDRYAHVFDKVGGDALAGPPFCTPGGLPFDPPCAATPDPRTRATVDEARAELRGTAPLVDVLALRLPAVQALDASLGGVVDRQHAVRVDETGANSIPGGGMLTHGAVYGEAMWRPTDWLAVSPGLRVDGYATGNSPAGTGAALGPKLALRAELPAGLFVRTSAGRGFRLPSFEERYLRFDHSELGYIVNGNPNLQPEVNQGARAEVGYAPRSDVELGVEVYGNFLENLITEEASGTNADAVPIFTYKNATRAYTAGVNVRARVGPFFGTRLDVSYQYLAQAIDASACPPGNAWFCSASDGALSLPLRPTHALDASVHHRLKATGASLFVRMDVLSDRVVDATTTAPGSVVVSLGLRQPIFSHAELTASLDNVTDSYDPVFGPKPGRSANLGLRILY